MNRMGMVKDWDKIPQEDLGKVTEYCYWIKVKVKL